MLKNIEKKLMRKIYAIRSHYMIFKIKNNICVILGCRENKNT